MACLLRSSHSSWHSCRRRTTRSSSWLPTTTGHDAPRSSSSPSWVRPPFPPPQFLPSGATPPFPPPIAGSPMQTGAFPLPPIPSASPSIPRSSPASASVQEQFALPDPSLRQKNPDSKKKMALKLQVRGCKFSPLSSSFRLNMH